MPRLGERTAEQREYDAKRNAPKYAREKAIKSILTAKYLKAKTIFDNYYEYNIDEAYAPDQVDVDGRSNVWREDIDPWLRIHETLPEFLEDYTKILVETGGPVTGESLESLASALLRVAKVDLEGAGRNGGKAVDENFKSGIMELVEKLKTTYGLPQSPEVVEVDSDDADE